MEIIYKSKLVVVTKHEIKIKHDDGSVSTDYEYRAMYRKPYKYTFGLLSRMVPCERKKADKSLQSAICSATEAIFRIKYPSQAKWGSYEEVENELHTLTHKIINQ